MFPIPRQTLRSTPLIKRFRLVLPIAFSLVAATSLAACGGDAGDEGQPAPTASTPATPSETTETSRPTEATPLGGGELIAFERLAPGNEGRDLYVVEPDGDEPRLLRSPGEYPHWSPDGSELAFLACLNPPDCTTGVALLERSTGDVKWFPMPDPDLFTACAVWAPSGEELACGGLSEEDPTRNGVYRVRTSDGKGLTRITRNPGGEDAPLAYSPDGSQLLLTRLDPSRDDPANHALFVTPISGGQPQRITPWGFTDDYASWSPDGRTIVFGTNGSLYRVSPEGKGFAEITLKTAHGSSAVSAFDVGFSPDGSRIVFSLGNPEPGIYTARPDGSDVQQLTTSPTEDHHGNWGAASGSE
jgi:Tol biopolymer transport system component